MPAAPLFWAIVRTQLVATLMCGFGLLLTAISWKLTGWDWLDLIAWLFILGSIRMRMIHDRFANYRTARHQKSLAMVNQSLHEHLATASPAAAANR